MHHYRLVEVLHGKRVILHQLQLHARQGTKRATRCHLSSLCCGKQHFGTGHARMLNLQEACVTKKVMQISKGEGHGVVGRLVAASPCLGPPKGAHRKAT